MRTKTYQALIRLLSDLRWHEATELASVTSYPEQWLSELQRDPTVEVDSDRRRLRLRVAPKELTT
jgi:hypothetical protein